MQDFQCTNCGQMVYKSILKDEDFLKVTQAHTAWCEKNFNKTPIKVRR